MILTAVRRTLLVVLTLMVAAPLLLSLGAQAQGTPLRLRITEGVFEPMPIALPGFVAETAGAGTMAEQVTGVIASDLTGSGLFREIPRAAHIGRIGSFDAPVQYADWRAINAQALVTGALSQTGDRITVRFRLHDVVSGQQMGEGLQFEGPAADWRRIGHKVADAVYSRITGETGYFDSQIVFVAESGPKDARVKRLAIMDQDGANARYLSDGKRLVLAPRFSPDGSRVLYTSYETGVPRIYLMDVASGRRQVLDDQPGSMTFAPRFSPDGRSIAFSLSQGGNSDLYILDLGSGNRKRLTTTPAIETAPSFSPDGARIVFESDRSGSQQLYVMPAGGGEAQRISTGRGRYATPVWSPRGDLIAFTKQLDGQFHIGIMRADGSEEQLLTTSFLDEGPSWSPNGRVLVFAREMAGAGGLPSLYTVEISGRVPPRQLNISVGASDPAWSPLRP